MSNLTTLFTEIADAIRTKKGTTGSIVASTFPSEIASIETNGGGAGTVEGAKIFASLEEMNADTTAQENDIALVYFNEKRPTVQGATNITVTFPETVVVPTAVTATSSFSSTQVGTGAYIKLVKTSCTIRNSSIGGTVLASYTSTDGKTYTRTSAENTITMSSVSSSNANYLAFFVVDTTIFGGLFEYKEGGWVIADNQFGIDLGTLDKTTGLLASDLIPKATLYDTISNLTLDTTVTDLSKAFYQYKGKSIPYIDISNVTNTYMMFLECTKLEEVRLLNTSNVTDMSYMFKACEALTTIPLLDTVNVTDCTQMFSGCTKLEEVPLLNTSNVTKMQNMFYGCKALQTIPAFNTSNVESMQNMFSGCTALVSIPLIDTSKVEDFNTMFYNCSSLTTVPALNASGATLSMSNMFKGCTALTNESLNNILAICASATSHTGTKTLAYIGLTEAQATTCKSLSNYSAFTAAGWVAGY